MNTEQAKRVIILKVLKAIRGNLLTQTSFVCCAADAAARQRDIFDYERDIFEAFIRERLDGCYTVTEWLKVTHNIEYRDYPFECRLDYRQRWVAAMIKEFSK